MVVGRVVVPSDLPVVSVILTRDWTMSAPGGASYRCTSGTNRFAAKIVSPGATDLGNKIYSTNVPGIGMRFSRGGATVNITTDYLQQCLSHHQLLFPRRVALYAGDYQNRGNHRQRHPGGG